MAYRGLEAVGPPNAPSPEFDVLAGLAVAEWMRVRLLKPPSPPRTPRMLLPPLPPSDSEAVKAEVEPDALVSDSGVAEGPFLAPMAVSLGE